MRNLWKLLLVLVPAIIILVIALIALRQAGRFPEAARRSVESQLRQATNRPVQTRRVQVGRRQVVIEDLTIYERTGRQVLAHAPRVVVEYSLPGALLQPGNLVGAIRSVIVYQPELYLRRDREGVWNVADLLARPPSVARFRGRVRVVDGLVRVSDFHPPGNLPIPQDNTFRRLDATAYLLPNGRTHLALGGLGPPDRLARVRLVGALGGREPAFGTVRLEGADLAYAWRYLRPGSAATVSAGFGDISATLLATQGQPLIVGQAAVRAATFRLPQLPRTFAATSGRIVLTPRDLWLRGVRTTVGSSPVRVSGLVTDFARPRLALTLASDRVAPAEAAAIFPRGLPEAIELPAPVAVQARLQGVVGALQVAGTVRAGALGISSIPLRQARSQFAYGGGAVYLDQVRAALGGGVATGQAWVLPGPPGQTAAALVGNVQNVSLETLRAVVPRSVTGRASGPIALVYRPQVGLIASLDLRQGRLGTLAYQRGHAVLAYQAGDLQLSYAQLETALGAVTAEGRVSAQGELDLQVAASQVNLAQLARQLGQRRTWGLGFLSGRVTGTLERPLFSGRVQAVNAMVAGQRLSLLAASVQSTGEQAQVEGVLFFRGAEVALSGTVGIPAARGEPVPLALQFEVRRASLAAVLELAGVEQGAQGMVQANVRVRGTLEQPQVIADLAVYAPVLAGQPFDEGAAYLTYANGRLLVEDARLLVDSSVIRASGSIGPQGQVDIAIASDRLELARLVVPALRDLGLSLSGEALLTGQVTGTREQPQARLTVTSSTLQIAGQPFTDLALHLRWQPGLVVVEQGSLQQSTASYTLSGQVNTARELLSLTGRVSDTSLATWRGALEDRRTRFEPGTLLRKFADQLAKLPRPLTGRLSADLAISGSFDQSLTQLSFEAADATMAGSALPQVTGRLQITPREVQISALEARQGESYATVRGTVQLAGPLDLDVDAFNLNARLFESWIKLPVQGSADVTAVVSGTLAEPQLVGSAEIVDVRGGGIQLDSVRVTRFSLAEQRLTLEEVALVRASHRALLSASLPVRISPFGLVGDQPLRVTVDLSGQDLALVAGVVPGIGDASGPLNASLVISGTPDDPALDGFVTVQSGRMRVSGLAQPVTNLNVDITLAGQSLVVRQLRGQVGRGTITATGTATLTTLVPDELERNQYQLALTLRALPLSVPRVLEGRADADLTLTNPPGGRPAVLGGEIRLSNVTAAVPPSGQVQAALLLPPVNVALDVSVIARENVWLRTPAANIQLAGVGHIGGSLASPAASASLESRRGVLSFPGAQFQLTFAAVDIYVPPPVTPPTGGPPVFSPRLTLRAEGQALVQAYRVFLTVAGPIDDLQPQLRSIPDLPQSELYALVIGVGAGPAAFGEQTRQLLTAGLGSLVARPLEQVLAAGLGLAEFSVEFGVAEPVRVRVGQYLVDRLYLAYARSVTGSTPTWLWRATYEITPSFWLGFSVNERQEQRFELQSVFRF